MHVLHATTVFTHPGASPALPRVQLCWVGTVGAAVVETAAVGEEAHALESGWGPETLYLYRHGDMSEVYIPDVKQHA